MPLLKLLILVLFPLSVVSQSKDDSADEQIRLFRTYQDYLAGNAIDKINLGNKNNVSVYYNKLVIREGKQKRKYSHGTLWGYQKGADVYRFFDSGTTFGIYGYHKIIARGGLILYSKKESGGYRMSSTYALYYYSKDLDSPIKELSVKNLEADFPNPAFIAEIKGLKNLVENTNEITTIYRKYY